MRDVFGRFLVKRKGFGGMLRNERTKRGITMHDLAQHMGWSPSFVSGLEHNREPVPNDDAILKIADFLGIDREQFLKFAKKERRMILREYTKEDLEIASTLQEKEFRCCDHSVCLPDDLDKSITEIMRLWNEEQLGGAVEDIKDLVIPARIFLHLGVLMAKHRQNLLGR